VGDVPANIKNGEHERREAIIARQIISELDLYDGLKDEVARAYEDVVVGQNEKLHITFKAFEKTDYISTAMGVWGETIKRDLLGLPTLKRRDHFVGLVIINNLTTVLVQYSNLFPNSIGKYIRNIEPVIDEAFKKTKDIILEKPILGDQERIRKQIPIFEEEWKKFKSHRG